MEWVFFLILVVNGQFKAMVTGPYESQQQCEAARSFNIPAKYTVLDITKCVRKPPVI